MDDDDRSAFVIAYMLVGLSGAIVGFIAGLIFCWMIWG